MRDVMTAEELAEHLHLHVSTIYRAVKAGELSAARFGRVLRFLRGDVQRWLSAKLTTDG